MAARLLLLLLVLTLFSHLVPAKADKSFDNFLKSDHTNNWAVLVRIFNETTLQDEMRRCFHDLKVKTLVYFQVCTSRFWFNYRHVANVLSIYRSVKRLGIPDRYEILFFCSYHILTSSVSLQLGSRDTVKTRDAYHLGKPSGWKFQA